MPDDEEDLNKKHLIGLKALSYKKARIDENTIIIECNILELDSFLDLKNWKLIHQETKIKVDKFSSYFVTYCVSKVRADGKLLVNLNDIESNLQSLKLKFYNLRPNREKDTSLFLFEVPKHVKSHFNDINLNFPDIFKIFPVSEFDPIENYVVKCTKCHLIGHTRPECKSPNFLCARCGKSVNVSKYK